MAYSAKIFSVRNYIAFFRNSSIPTSSVIIKLERVANVSNNLIMANTVNGFYLQCHFKKHR